MTKRDSTDTKKEVYGQITKPTPIKSMRTLPRTVALIPDGNARWADLHDRTTIEGHLAGFAVGIARAKDACELGIEQLSLFGFSVENWKRPAREVDDLMNLFATHFRCAVAALEPLGVRICHLGSRSGLPNPVLDALEDAESATAHNTRMTFFVALNYGGRQELLEAAKYYTGSGEEEFRQLLYAPEMLDLDFIIRTGGEHRLSNGFTWHSSYSELLFVDELWPDFSRDCFELALAQFGQRVRTMGGR